MFSEQLQLIAETPPIFRKTITLTTKESDIDIMTKEIVFADNAIRITLLQAMSATEVSYQRLFSVLLNFRGSK